MRIISVRSNMVFVGHDVTHSLSPVQMMDQEVYYHIAEDAMVHSVLLLSVIVMVRNAHHRLHSLVRRWQRSADVGIANAVAAAHVKMQQWKDMMEKILLLLKWLMAYGEIALLYAEDLTIFVRRRNRFHPRCFQRIQDIGRRDCYSWFGLTTSNLERLFVHLRVPENFTTSSRHVYTGEECYFPVPHE